MHHPRQLPLTALLGDTPRPLNGRGCRLEHRRKERTMEDLTPQKAKKKKRRGKPQDRSRLTRNKVVQLRLTEAEVATLKSAAAAAGMSMADYVMAGVHESRRIVMAGAIDLRTEMLREGNNLNQALMLAYAARKEGRPADMERIQAAVAKVESNLDRMAELQEKWDADLTEEAGKM
jgi:predicted DNA binding CopG/RHH family protein